MVAVSPCRWELTDPLLCTNGVVSKPGIFLNDPKSRYRFFLLLSFSQVVSSL